MSTKKMYCSIMILISIFSLISITIWQLKLGHQNTEFLYFDKLVENAKLYGVLPEIMPRSESIFLVETSGKTKMELKELCVIESVAKYHPNNQIYLLMTSPMLEDDNFESLMESYDNLQSKYLYLPSLIHGTLLESLNWREIIQDSKYSVSHLSDFARYLILYNFGGTYLDLDALIIKQLPEVPNFIGRENMAVNYLGKYILKFQSLLCKSKLTVLFLVEILSKSFPYFKFKVDFHFCDFNLHDI